ncbi:peroxisomal biogenesis factor 11 [Tricharina praecox]|uniref:peroxisomal biogenesis factor 11 n=1 Tax=Tricharina praecox TaxID=43433 RepID=UPI0022209DA2|nr:peroxisomal biogenesis factor 11 [Tricharina praecox]KAI5844092.1 peroxisomal biogenesis factor 11 [Tricharina praecox]
MVADTLTYHPTLAHYLRFVATTVGRDKALRLVQYMARFLSWYLLRKGYAASSIAPWDAIKKTFGQARKAMRIGKNVEHMKAASEALDSKTLTPVAKYLTALRQIGYAGYLTLDTVGFFASTKIITMSPITQARLNRNAQKLWMTGIAASIVHSLYQLQAMQERESRIIKTVANGKLEGEKIRKDRAKLQTQLLQDSCDIILPATGLGLTGFDEGVVGVAGAISSYLGLKAAWQKTA